MKKIYLKRNFISFVVMMGITSAAIYFRLYYPLGLNAYDPEKIQADAEAIVTQSIEQQLQGTLQNQLAHLAPDVRKKLIEAQARLLIEKEPKNFRTTVEATKKALQENRFPRQSRRYLLEADPYYYYHLTENILSQGSLSRNVRGGKFYDPQRRHPEGVWSFWTLHPYWGTAMFVLSSFFRWTDDLMVVLSFVPLSLVLFSIFAFIHACHIQRFSSGAIALGLLSFVLAPIFLQRSFFGWYDTDPYNLLFPILILSAYLNGIQRERHALWFNGILSGFLTGIYALFWVGWPWIAGVMAMLSLIMSLYWRFFSPVSFKRTLVFFFTYAMAAVVTLILVLTPAGFFEAIRDVLFYLPQFSTSQPNLWPNVFVAVGETRSISLQKLIFLTGNYAVFGVALLGLLGGLYFWKQKNFDRAGQVLVWGIVAIPTFFLSLKVERFALLFVIPLSFLLMYGIETGLVLFRGFPKRIKMLKSFSRIFGLAGWLFFIVLLVPFQVALAHTVAMRAQPIMNDAWFQMLQRIKQQTNPNSIIYSWWPPGHFITSIADRAVIADGGSQHLPETYWVARFFMAEDEGLALGILRMLHRSGNQAMDFLLERNLNFAEAIQLLETITSGGREEAWQSMPSKLSMEEKERLILLTKGNESGNDAYVFIYNDMVEKTLALSFMAGWNFTKAESWYKADPLNRSGRTGYLDSLKHLSDGFMRYMPAVPLQETRDGFLIFENGLRVNMETGEAKLVLPQKGVAGEPIQIFYLENGILKELGGISRRLEISGLLGKDEKGDYFSLLADPKLIRSLLFRLFYLRGESLEYFEHVFSEYDEETKISLSLFKVHWPEDTKKMGKSH